MEIKKGRRIAILAGIIAVVVLGVAGWLSWPSLRFWYLFEPLGKNAQGYPEYRHRQTGIIFVSLPGGTFWMGAQKEDPNGKNYDPDAADDEGPVHEVTLSTFLIGKYEVTLGQWRAAIFRGEELLSRHPWNFRPFDLHHLPVENVSWDEIQRFEAKTGLALPTEAQWEYACRAGTTTPIAGTGRLDDMGWYDETSRHTTHPVGQKAPNGFGLHDMNGNIWEWCEDAFDVSFYGKPEASGPDPLAESGWVDRVIRGGSGGGDAWICRSSSRIGLGPQYGEGLIGFRAAWRP